MLNAQNETTEEERNRESSDLVLTSQLCDSQSPILHTALYPTGREMSRIITLGRKIDKEI